MTESYFIDSSKSNQAKTKSTRRLTTDDFISRSKAVHGDRYSYSQTVYKNRRTNVIITCHQHGDFEQKSINHMQGSNCPRCVKDARSLTTEEFIKKSKDRYPDLYTYERTLYVNYRTKLTITCKLHGDFSHRAEQHFNANGCPKCSLEKYSGYSRSDFEKLCRARDGLGTLYIIELFNNTERFFKVGITSRNVKDRFSKKKLPYKFRVLQKIEGAPSKIFNLEKTLHRHLRSKSYTPKVKFAGHTECFFELMPDLENILQAD